MLTPWPHLLRRLAPVLLLTAIAVLLAGPKGPPTAVVDRVILIGIDGIDTDTIERLIETDSLPNLAKLISAGTMAPMKTVSPPLPPVVWTSIATAKDAKEHGITGFARRDAEKPQQVAEPLVDSRSWRAEPVWRLLGDDHRVAVVGWSTTWPAAPVPGVLISDRLIPDRRDAWLENHTSGAGLPELTYPLSLKEQLLPLVEIDDETLTSELAELFLDAPTVAASTGKLGDPVHELALAYGRDRGYMRALAHVLAAGPVDFTAIRLTGLEIALRAFPPAPTGAKAETPDPRGVTVADRYARWLDSRLAPLFVQASAKCLVLVVSDHGFGANRPLDPSDPGSLYAAAEPAGVLVLSGGPVTPGAAVRGARAQDVGTIVLHVLGREIGLDMDGTPTRAVLGERGRGAIHYRHSYEQAKKPASTPKPASPQPGSTATDPAATDNATSVAP